MPIYEYQCQHCGHLCEVIQKISDLPLIECTECGKPSLEKKISHTSFQLKGSGWYVTDFKNSGKPDEKKAVADKKPAVTEKSVDTKSTDTKATDSE